MALEPGTLARAWKADRQDHSALRLFGRCGRRDCRFGSFVWRFGLAGFASWTARSGQRWWLRSSRLTIAASATSTPAVAVASHLLLRRCVPVSFHRGLGFLKLWVVRLRFELRLLAHGFRTSRLGKLRLQRRGTIWSRLFCRRLAPLAAVAAPSTHVALVTRLPSLEQSGLFPFCASASSPFMVLALPRSSRDATLFAWPHCPGRDCAVYYHTFAFQFALFDEVLWQSK